MKLVIGLLAGLVFGIGLAVAGMTDPAKVLGFLDMTGAWDPSLAFVMGGAVITFGIGQWLVRKQRPEGKALSGDPLPKQPGPFAKGFASVDKRTVIGAVLFGLGWGLVGLCPGPALAGLATGSGGIVAFIAAMLMGMVLARRGAGMGRPRTQGDAPER